MADIIAKAEVLKIAHLSNLSLRDEDIDKVTRQLDSVLSYAARVKEVTGSADDFMYMNIKQNKTRPDVVDQVSLPELLDQVPVKEGSLIIVPMILETV